MPTPYAPSWSTVTVRGTYRLGDNTPDSGSVWFTFTDRITDAADDLIFPAGGTFEARLGANTGTISVDVPCVDDPDIFPNTWSIKVEEKLKSGHGATYYIRPTLAMVADGLNLRTVVVPNDSVAPAAALLKGVPGGVAALNLAGKVVNADGSLAGGLSTVASADIADATATGRSLLKATDATNARALIGAGTSSLTLGTTGTTAKAGNYVPAWTEVTGKPTTFTPSTHTHTAADLSGVVKTVNGGAPDAAGNVAVAAGAPTLANIPAGSVLYTAGTTRPTSRTDVMVIFVGADPGANALDNDMWTRPV